ncbi:MAG: ATP-binding cassette domain-containing protein [Spirochaetes bacterium]|jgi:ATP-binding cassette subfamily B protein|nr:ATP-binding cassette domain-containing protein [Spirochaetota bacterium]
MLGEYRTLLPFVRKYRWYYIFGIVTLVITSGGQLFIPQLIRRAIDTMTVTGFSLSTIGRYMLALVALAAVIAAARFGWRYFLHGASRQIEAELREQLFGNLLNLPASYYRETTTGDLMARATNDLNNIRMAAGMGLVAFVDGIFMTLAILIILFSRHPQLTLIVVFPLPFVTVAILFAGRLMSRLFRRVQESFAELSSDVQESVTGVRVIKTFGKEGYFNRRFADSNDEYQRRNLAYVRVQGMFFPAVTFLSGLTSLLLLRFGGVAVIVGTVTPGEFVATLTYLEMLVWPMMGAGFLVNLIARGAASLKRLNSVIKREPDIRSPQNPVAAVDFHNVTVRGLSYRYVEDGDEALSDIDLEVPAGHTVGILGRTGSGKSTLVALFPRLIDPPSGTVFVGSHDVRDYDLQALRSAFAVVPQDTFLFSATISDNIRFAAQDAGDELISRVSDISTISRDMRDFPDGWETLVGERGVTLSGGQKQRVAISRALAAKRPILVLDDALSAVDTESEEKILSRLMAEREGMTNIIIAHRVSALSRSDFIYVLDEGRIVQRGTHEELITRAGMYRDIYELQQAESREETHPGGRRG